MLRYLLMVLLAIGMLVAKAANAQNAQKIPDSALAGRYMAQSLPYVRIDRNDYQLSPGVRIFSERKLLITPTRLPAGAPVRYLLDAERRVKVMWIVSEDQLKEAQERGPNPRRTDPAAQ